MGNRLIAADLESLELSWALAALSHYFPLAARHDEVAGVGRVLAQRLMANQQRTSGLFRASRRRRGWLRRLKSDATLASQVYPIYGLVRFGEVFGQADAIQAAQRCGEALAALQGPLGQWWWRYDVTSGQVIDGYPVYPVNQDASVPMALGSLARHVSADRYSQAVAHGLTWECGQNEPGLPLIDDEGGRIARGVERDGEGWKVSWDWNSYHPARAISAVLEVGDVFGVSAEVLTGPGVAGGRTRDGR